MPDGTRPAPPDDTVRVILSGTVCGVPWEIIWWLQLTAGTRALADLNTVLAGINSSWGTRMKPNFNALVVLTQVQGIWKTPGGGEIVGANGTVQTGTSANPQLLNAATCAVVNWQIGQYYRGGKPRTYLPAPPATFTTDGVHLTGAAISTYQPAATNMLADINALTAGGITNVKLGTVSFQRSNAWRVPPVFYPYTGCGVRSILGTQRRRLIP